MYKKYLFFLSFFIFSIFTVSPAFAQTPENDLDAKCFTRAECMAARAEMGVPVDQQQNGFYNNTAETRQACKDKEDDQGTELGFCLPAGQTVTAVKFGGETKFANIGVFIQFMYRYGVVFAGILAVIIIIVAGLQWTASGGNSSTIDSAKKRIAGAVTGLVLASASFIILNAINPSTLNLRLPQIWMIKGSPIENSYKYCLAIPAIADGANNWIVPKIAPYQDNYQSIPPDTFQPAYTTQGNDPLTQIVFPDKTESSIATCGEKMYIQNTEGNSCIGTYCATGVCYDDKKECAQLEGGSGILGRISWESGKYLDQIWLKVACEEADGSWRVEDIDDIDLGEAKNFYKFENTQNTAVEECGSLDKVKGYFFIVEVNDSDSGNTNDDQWVGGKSFCRQQAGNSCGFYGASTVNGSDVQEEWLSALYNAGELFAPNDVHNKGLACDFQIREEFMPNLGNGVIANFIAGGAHLINKDVGAIVDAAIISDLDAAKVCPYLQNKDQEFQKAINERREARR